MSWTWQYEDAGGDEIAPEGVSRSGTFTTQGDAETWLGETWRDLLSAGVAQVSLLDNGQVTYTMGLDAPQ